MIPQDNGVEMYAFVQYIIQIKMVMSKWMYIYKYQTEMCDRVSVCLSYFGWVMASQTFTPRDLRHVMTPQVM